MAQNTRKSHHMSLKRLHWFNEFACYRTMYRESGQQSCTVTHVAFHRRLPVSGTFTHTHTCIHTYTDVNVYTCLYPCRFSTVWRSFLPSHPTPTHTKAQGTPPQNTWSVLSLSLTRSLTHSLTHSLGIILVSLSPQANYLQPKLLGILAFFNMQLLSSSAGEKDRKKLVGWVIPSILDSYY